MSIQASVAAESLLMILSDRLMVLAAAAADGEGGEHKRNCEECAWDDSRLYIQEPESHATHKRRRCSASRTASAPNQCASKDIHWFACQYSWASPAPQLDVHHQETCHQAQPQQSEMSLGMWQEGSSGDEDEVDSGSSGGSLTSLDVHSDEEDVSSFTTTRTSMVEGFAFPACATEPKFPVFLWGR